jgi:hypothetical protein
MTPKEISQLIEREIRGDWAATNRHGCDLKKCLIRPKKRKVFFADEIKEVWIVLEEDPVELDKHKIFFDAKTRKFGLVIGSRDAFGLAVNSYDTFLAAFKAM